MSAPRSAADLEAIAARVRTSAATDAPHPDQRDDVPVRAGEEIVDVIGSGQHQLRLAVIDTGERIAIHLRVFRADETGEFIATRHGLRVYRGQVGRLIGGLRRAQRIATERTLETNETPKGHTP